MDRSAHLRYQCKVNDGAGSGITTHDEDNKPQGGSAFTLGRAQLDLAHYRISYGFATTRGWWVVYGQLFASSWFAFSASDVAKGAIQQLGAATLGGLLGFVALLLAVLTLTYESGAYRGSDALTTLLSEARWFSRLLAIGIAASTCAIVWPGSLTAALLVALTALPLVATPRLLRDLAGRSSAAVTATRIGKKLQLAQALGTQEGDVGTYLNDLRTSAIARWRDGDVGGTRLLIDAFLGSVPTELNVPAEDLRQFTFLKQWLRMQRGDLAGVLYLADVVGGHAVLAARQGQRAIAAQHLVVVTEAIRLCIHDGEQGQVLERALEVGADLLEGLCRAIEPVESENGMGDQLDRSINLLAELAAEWLRSERLAESAGQVSDGLLVAATDLIVIARTHVLRCDSSSIESQARSLASDLQVIDALSATLSSRACVWLRRLYATTDEVSSVNDARVLLIEAGLNAICTMAYAGETCRSRQLTIGTLSRLNRCDIDSGSAWYINHCLVNTLERVEHFPELGLLLRSETIQLAIRGEKLKDLVTLLPQLLTAYGSSAGHDQKVTRIALRTLKECVLRMASRTDRYLLLRSDYGESNAVGLLPSLEGWTQTFASRSYFELLAVPLIDLLGEAAEVLLNDDSGFDAAENPGHVYSLSLAALDMASSCPTLSDTSIQRHFACLNALRDRRDVRWHRLVGDHRDWCNRIRRITLRLEATKGPGLSNYFRVWVIKAFATGQEGTVDDFNDLAAALAAQTFADFGQSLASSRDSSISDLQVGAALSPFEKSKQPTPELYALVMSGFVSLAIWRKRREDSDESVKNQIGYAYIDARIHRIEEVNSVYNGANLVGAAAHRASALVRDTKTKLDQVKHDTVLARSRLDASSYDHNGRLLILHAHRIAASAEAEIGDLDDAARLLLASAEAVVRSELKDGMPELGLLSAAIELVEIAAKCLDQLSGSLRPEGLRCCEESIEVIVSEILDYAAHSLPPNLRAAPVERILKLYPFLPAPLYNKCSTESYAPSLETLKEAGRRRRTNLHLHLERLANAHSTPAWLPAMCSAALYVHRSTKRATTPTPSSVPIKLTPRTLMKLLSVSRSDLDDASHADERTYPPPPEPADVAAIFDWIAEVLSHRGNAENGDRERWFSSVVNCVTVRLNLGLTDGLLEAWENLLSCIERFASDQQVPRWVFEALLGPIDLLRSAPKEGEPYPGLLGTLVTMRSIGQPNTTREEYALQRLEVSLDNAIRAVVAEKGDRTASSDTRKRLEFLLSRTPPTHKEARLLIGRLMRHWNPFFGEAAVADPGAAHRDIIDHSPEASARREADIAERVANYKRTHG